MEKVVLLLVVCLSVFVRSAPNDSEMVWLKDETTSLQTDKRKLSDPNLPDNLTFQLLGGSRSLTLNLKRNHAIDPNADVYFVRKSNDGRSHLEKELHLETEELAYYQDRHNGAFMTVKCLRTSNGRCDRIINGNMLIDERNYDLRPADNDVTSRDVLDAPNLGTRYVLHDQTNVESGLSVTHKDATTVNVEQEVKDLFRRFPNGQKHFPLPNYALVSRNGSTLHNRGNLKQVYYVETAVVLEQGIWNLHLSLINNTAVMDRDVERKLREVYSHIMNGVNLRYKEIDDPNIEIIVSPHKFYIFKKLEDFSLSDTKAKFADGKYNINDESYLHDLALWTHDFSKFSDHVMLFTRYDMYDDTTGKRSIGRSFRGKVCDPYYKTSIVKSGDYFSTVTAAAHELGHKMCLTNVGVAYDINEWNEIKQKMPGQMYSLNQQCEFILGHGSIFCGTVTPNICHFMRCTDPHWKICLPKYFSAHRGTNCGENKWCMEGLCVSKSSK